MKGLLLSLLSVLVFVGCSGTVEKKAQYNYISAQETAKLMREDASQLFLIDIQEKDDFAEEHLQGAIETNAYPVKTDDEKARLAKLLPIIKPNQKIVVICPRGGGGANRAYDFLVENGVNKDNIFTLTDGQYGWPREEITDVLAK